MEVVRVLSTALLLVGLAACATRPDPRTETKSPYPDAGTGNVVREKDGTLGFLKVHTPKVHVDQDGNPYELPNDSSCGSSYLVSTGFSIHDREGRSTGQVPNHSALIVADEEPMEVILPAGRYLVRVDRPERGVQAFWVTIEAGRLTEVDPARLVPAKPSAERDTLQP